jgi:hypothetical protein
MGIGAEERRAEIRLHAQTPLPRLCNKLIDRGAMLTISKATFEAMTREHMLDRVHRFLKTRSPDPLMQNLLASPQKYRALWQPWYWRFDNLTEHAIAVRLSYVLAAQAHNLDLGLLEIEGEAAETEMKCRLESAFAIDFIAFDEG